MSAHDGPTLFDVIPTIVPQAGEPVQTIEAAFLAFHRANPWVYDALVALTRDLVDRGRQRVGIKMLFEVLRWQWQRATTDPSSDFRLNNNYTSRYARLIMASEAGLADVFETRRLISEAAA